MFCGESVPVKIRTKAFIMDDLIDWFGKDFRIIEKSEDTDDIVIAVNCNQNAMFFWALQYGEYTEVLSPENLRAELAETIRKMNERYSE